MTSLALSGPASIDATPSNVATVTDIKVQVWVHGIGLIAMTSRA